MTTRVFRKEQKCRRERERLYNILLLIRSVTLVTGFGGYERLGDLVRLFGGFIQSFKVKSSEGPGGLAGFLNPCHIVTPYQ